MNEHLISKMTRSLERENRILTRALALMLVVTLPAVISGKLNGERQSLSSSTSAIISPVERVGDRTNLLSIGISDNFSMLPSR